MIRDDLKLTHVCTSCFQKSLFFVWQQGHKNYDNRFHMSMQIAANCKLLYHDTAPTQYCAVLYSIQYDTMSMTHPLYNTAAHRAAQIMTCHNLIIENGILCLILYLCRNVIEVYDIGPIILYYPPSQLELNSTISQELLPYHLL